MAFVTFYRKFEAPDLMTQSIHKRANVPEKQIVGICDPVICTVQLCSKNPSCINGLFSDCIQSNESAYMKLDIS